MPARTALTLTPIQLTDRVAIADLWGAFADAVSRLEPEGLRDLFTSDGEWHLTGIGGHVGQDALIAMITDVLAPWETMVHALHSSRVWFDAADPDRATGQVYFTEFGVKEGQPVLFAGVYHDRFQRGADGVWRFALRRYDGLFNRIGDEVIAQPYPADLRGGVPRAQ